MSPLGLIHIHVTSLDCAAPACFSPAWQRGWCPGRWHRAEPEVPTHYQPGLSKGHGCWRRMRCGDLGTGSPWVLPCFVATQLSLELSRPMGSTWEQGPSGVPALPCNLAQSPLSALSLPGTPALVGHPLNLSPKSCPLPLEALGQGLSLVMQSRVPGRSQVPPHPL